MALTKLTSNLIEGGTGTDWVTAIQTSNFTAAAGKGYFVNTTSQVLYVTLPVGVVGMEITIQDYAGTFATNKVILNANGSEKIQGSALEGRINTNNATAVLIYQDATKGWTSQDVELDVNTVSWATPTGQSLTYSTPSPQSSQGATGVTFPTTTFTATKAGSTISGTATIAGLPSGITAAQTITGSGAGNTLTVTLTGTFPSTNYLNTALTLSGLSIVTPLEVSYLVVAGGGGGGGTGQAGGGGAGGLRTNYGGTALTLASSTNYLVTVGAGGASSGSGTSGSGIDSVFHTITSSGGGGGGAHLAAGSSGGSGGGAGTNGSGGAGNTPSTNPSQGYAGSTPGTYAMPYSGGGGGGYTASGTGGGNVSGNGGAGIAYTSGNSITGSALSLAGGGGGGTYDGTAGTATNGGGAGAAGTGLNSGLIGTVGTPNTGGGGGGTGNYQPGFVGANGGSGIVILRYPNSFTISGLSGTTTTVGADKVITFTSGTGNIQFN
jgi:hypothetical protein